jgi:hypothetical protein
MEKFNSKVESSAGADCVSSSRFHSTRNEDVNFESARFYSPETRLEKDYLQAELVTSLRHRIMW